MPTKVFINLAVKNLDRSLAFFQNLGFSFNPQFTDEKAGCMIVSDSIFVMLLTDTHFKSFIDTEVCNAHHYESVPTIVNGKKLKYYRSRVSTSSIIPNSFASVAVIQ